MPLINVKSVPQFGRSSDSKDGRVVICIWTINPNAAPIDTLMPD